MELRHLRYFVAVAEEGSLTNAAERRLHTAQPSLSRQIRDLEAEVGVKLLKRSARGIELTPAGRVFLDHARLALLQVEAATEAARRAINSIKPAFTVGFLTGHDVLWLPETLRILREEQPAAEITLSSQSSPDLASALIRGTTDVAIMRRESHAPGLAFKLLAREPVVAVLPIGHRLAMRSAISAHDLAGEAHVMPTEAGAVLKTVVAEYMAKAGVAFRTDYVAENISSAMALVASTGSVTLLPLYTQNLLSPLVVIRPLQGEQPMIDLVVGYNKANTSQLLQRFLMRTDDLVNEVSRQQRSRLERALA